MNQSRRRFLSLALGVGAAPWILPAGLRAANGGPNGRIGMGFIGMGRQSEGLLRGFLSRRNDVQVLAVCDVDTTRREAARKVVEDYYAQDKPAGWKGCDVYTDFRKLLERPDIDAVCIATPDHWHAVITVAAAKAGKDIYCEKPLTETVTEALAVMAAVHGHKRILQTGSMQRSFREFRTTCELVRNGAIGKVERIETSFGPPGKWCDLPEEAAEPGLDWDMWLGPAPMRPYNAQLAPRGQHKHFPVWRHYREYGGGMVTDWGAHMLDIVQWGLGADEKGGPIAVVPASGSDAKQGGILKYPGDIPVKHVSGDGNGVVFYGDCGEIHVQRGKFRFLREGKEISKFWDKNEASALPVELGKAEKAFLKDPKVRLYKSNDHTADFINAVRARTQPVCGVDIGARTVIACHLLGFSYYYGKPFQWDPAANTFAAGTGDPKWLHREYRGDWKIA